MNIRAYARFGTIAPIISMAFERVIPSHMYSTMGFLGFFVASRGLGWSLIEAIPVLTVTFSAMGLYVINDVFDLEIDKISHPERSLPQGKVSVNQALVLGSSLLIAGPVIAIATDPIAGIMISIIALLGVLYSVPPIRLRKYPVVPNLMIGLGVFFAFIGGAAFKVPVTGRIVFGALLVMAFFSFQSFVKDLEEGEGDSAGGVQSLPVMLGHEMAFKITSIVALSTIIFPVLFIIIFDLNIVFIAAIVVLYLIEGYCISMYSRFLNGPSPTDMEKWETKKTLDRPLTNLWLMRVMICFLGMQTVLVISTLV